MIVSRASLEPMAVQFLEVTDPEELARIGVHLERVKKNTAYWNSHAAGLFDCYRGHYVCIAGEQFFIAETSEEAEALGAAAHPEDDGRFLMYLPKEKMVRI